MDQTGNDSEHPQPTVAQARAHIEQDFADLREAAERRGEELITQVRSLVDQHPFVSVGAAFGLGYLLSGALLSRATMRLAMLGARWYAGRMVRDFIEAGQAGGMQATEAQGMAAGGLAEQRAGEGA